MPDNPTDPSTSEQLKPTAQTDRDDDNLSLLEAFRKDAREEEEMLKRLFGETSSGKQEGQESK